MLLSRNELVDKILENTTHNLITDQKELKKIARRFLKNVTIKHCTAKYKRSVIYNVELLKNESLVFYTGSGDNIQLWSIFDLEVNTDKINETFGNNTDNYTGYIIQLLGEDLHCEYCNSELEEEYDIERAGEDFYCSENCKEKHINQLIKETMDPIDKEIIKKEIYFTKLKQESMDHQETIKDLEQAKRTMNSTNANIILDSLIKKRKMKLAEIEELLKASVKNA